jgi:hypothetical protein
MSLPAFASYLTVALAVAAGIIGMGITYNAVMAGNLHELSLGIPPLLVGLWWAGHELGRSMISSRMRHAQKTKRRSP